MRIFSFIQWLLLIITVITSSCKSHKNAINVKDDVSYNTRRSFNQHYYEGAKLKALGEFEASIKEFNLALMDIPSSHDVMYQLGNIYFKDKKLIESIRWAEMAVNKNPIYNFWYYGQLAQIYSTAKQYDKSAATFAKMVEKDPSRKSSYEEAGNQYLNAKKAKEAVRFFEKSISKFGAEEDLCRKLEALYFDLSQPNEAVAVIKKLSESNPSDIKYLGLLAESYTKANRLIDAKNTYLKMLQLDETNGFAIFGMADMMRRESNYTQAYIYLSKGFSDKRVAIQHKLKVISSYYFLINKDETSKNQAFELSRILLETHPEEASAYQVQSDMFFAIDKLAESRDYLKKGLAIDGKDYRIWQKLFGLDIKLNNNQFLYEDSKLALELFTTQPGLFIIHCQSALRVLRYDEAIESANQGLDISFKSDEKIQLYLTLADAYFEKGNFDKSDQYFEKALETEQGNALVLNNYAYNLYKRNIRLAKAEEMVLKALAAEPNSGSFADTYGCILMALNKFPEAETWLKKSLELEGDNAEILEHLGDLYIKIGKPILAIETYKKALSKDGTSKTLPSKIKSLEETK